MQFVVCSAVLRRRGRFINSEAEAIETSSSTHSSGFWCEHAWRHIDAGAGVQFIVRFAYFSLTNVDPQNANPRIQLKNCTGWSHQRFRGFAGAGALEWGAHIITQVVVACNFKPNTTARPPQTYHVPFSNHLWVMSNKLSSQDAFLPGVDEVSHRDPNFSTLFSRRLSKSSPGSRCHRCKSSAARLCFEGGTCDSHTMLLHCVLQLVHQDLDTLDETLMQARKIYTLAIFHGLLLVGFCRWWRRCPIPTR